jgi:hypothetical protein
LPILCRSVRLLLRNSEGPRLRRCPVVFSKLSKVLNQEDALGAPCLGCDFCSPQAPSRGAGMLRTGRRDPSLWCHIYCWDHRVITPTCADAFPVVGGSARVGALRCRAKQGRREDGADVWILTSIIVRFFGRFRERKEFFGNHGGALLLHHRAIHRLPTAGVGVSSSVPPQS